MALRAFRNEKRLTQEILGERVGLHPTWISHIESGRVNPTLSNLALLSEGLGIRLSELIARAEEWDRRLQSE
jgi:transcriptional regulator with XRE-family HTH domain